MHSIKIIISALLLSLSNCVLTSNEQHIKLSSIPESQIAPTLSDAIQNTTVKKIPLGDTISSVLTESDPVLFVGKTDTFRSNYQLYTLHSKENELYTIEIISICDSTSIEKNILFPLLIITDNNGNVLKHHKIISYETISSNLSSSFQIYGLQEVYISDEGEYYIFVVSDNSTTKGYTITTAYRETTFKFTLKGIFGRRSPWGSFKLSVKKKH